MEVELELFNGLLANTPSIHDISHRISLYTLTAPEFIISLV